MTTEVNNVSSSSDAAFRQSDVLLGRGSGPNRWKGNVRFRQLVLKSFQDYSDSCTSSSSLIRERYQHLERPVSFSALSASVKNKLASNVFSAIERENGRFLQKLTQKEFELEKHPPATIMHKQEEDGNGGDKVVFVYVEASKRKAMEKIKQTFRFLNDQKQARRLSKVAEAERIFTDSVKASFATASSSPAFTPSLVTTDRMTLSVKTRNLDALSRTLGWQHGNESLSLPILPGFVFPGLANAASHPLQFQLEQQMRLERDILLASSLRTAQIKAEIMKQRMFPYRAQSLSVREALDLVRRLAMGASSPSL
jgi:hypothetical protein